jgi:ankyrin repeat protein
MAVIILCLLLAQTAALHEAVLHIATAAEALIEAGADPNLRDSHARTPLHVAVSSSGFGKLDLIRLLLKKGADPNSRDDSGASPLDEAAWRGSAAKAALLLDGGAKVDAPDTRTGATPLNEAAFRGHLEVVELLLARGADASIKDHAGFSPIENAVRQHQPGVLRVLLGNGKNAEPANRLMEMAVRRGYADSVEVLLDAGAGIDARSASGSTALYDAALAGNGAMVSLLVNRGAEVNAVETGSGTTPLYAAAALGREEAVAILLLGGANPNLVGKEGGSPLHAAESNGYRTIAERIRAAGGQ